MMVLYMLIIGVAVSFTALAVLNMIDYVERTTQSEWATTGSVFLVALLGFGIIVKMTTLILTEFH